ncbi:hypothetical protein CRG98_045674 [Punica granatum]|uniref:DUF4005 domain-containing protein n=1 Tax=Punica granatum TaxID=22663 RepID=A0A2I0HQE1_PUNGR|nr:hypothetical protein CRG98_045674 [Punica granatum]
MARKKKSWFDFVKRFFRLDARSRAEKKERRRRWAFEKLQNKRLPPPITGPPQRAVLSEAEEVQSKSALNVAIATAAAAEAAMAAAQIAAEVFKLSTGVLVPQSITTADQHKQEKDESFAIRVDRKESGQGNAQSLAAHQCEMKIRELEDLKIKAAIKIQAAFRGYLARKALRALKGIVKLQAIIRGRAVRRQAITTLQRLQSIVNIHSQVCATRSHVGERTGGYNENSHIRQWRDRIKRSAESENRKPNGRWRYWLEQWVDTQLNKSREYEDLDPVPSPTPKSKEDNGRRQLKPGSYLKQQQQGNPFEQSGSPVSVPKRQIRHKKQCSMGDDTFPSSPSIPTYMAATESARAKVRSLSSPKLRPGAFDTYSDSYSPYKSKLSLVSSVISEVPTLNCSYKGGKLSGQQQRSPSLKGLPCAVKSGRVTKDLNLE